ncbi:MAG: hypothetical protein VW644_00580 [Alphaproteobacteria bacterium]|jgi:hypothetical protein
MANPLPATDAGHDDTPPALFEVLYNSRTQAIKLVLILCIPALVAFAVFASDTSEIDTDTWRFLGAIVVLTLAWAVGQARRVRDRTPQVTIGPDGILARHWRAGLVPWENIEFIAHSSTVRRGIIQQLARSRRGPYLLFKFRDEPPFVADAPFPMSLLQRLQSSFERQEPVIMEHGLDRSATAMLTAIQDHLEAWRAKQPPEAGDAGPVQT